VAEALLWRAGQWHLACNVIRRLTDVREKLAAQGFDVIASDPQAFAAVLTAEFAKWAAVIKAAGLKAAE